MACGKCDPSGCACGKRQRLGPALSADGDTSAVAIHPSHNWLRITVSPLATTVLAGDWTAILTVEDPESPNTNLTSNLGVLLFDPLGTQLLVHVGNRMAKQLSLRLAGYAGAGGIQALVESWRED